MVKNKGKMIPIKDVRRRSIEKLPRVKPGERRTGIVKDNPHITGRDR